MAESFDPHAPAPTFDLPNLRGLGGRRTSAGAWVRPGLVLRSSALAGASSRDLETLARLGLRTVVDLRSAWERERAPEAHLLPAGVAYLVADVSGDNLVISPMWQLVMLHTAAERQAEFGAGRAEAGFEAKFRGFVTGEGPRRALGQLFAALARPGGLPALFHCSTGKDRTGWAAAALLSYLGVPDDAVMADFLAGNAATRQLLRSVIDCHVAEGGQPDDLDALVGVRPSYLQAALEAVVAGYGSVEQYVERGLGLSQAGGRRLRTALLEPTRS